MRWIFRGLIVLAGLVVLALAVLYGGSEYILRRGHEVPMAQVPVPHDAASIAEGARIAKIANCRDCHGANGEGRVLFEAPGVGRVAPPPLAVVAATMSDAELVRAIRHGVHKDGSSLFIMPTHALAHISDEDAGRIVAWIRTLKPGPADSKARNAYGPIGRALILTGAFPAMANAATLSEPKRPSDVGRYYVSIACLACHKLHDEGMMEDGTTRVPPLAPMAAAYDPDKFLHLLHTGEGAGKRDLGIMSVVAKAGFVALTDGEVDAIKTYLKAEADRLPPQ